MSKFASKHKHSTPVRRRSRLSRFGYRGAKTKVQQEKIHQILRSTSEQTMLTVSTPDHKNEQEADYVADQVVRGPQDDSLGDVAGTKFHRQTVGEGGGTRSLQAIDDSAEFPLVTKNIQDRLNKSKGSGQPLPKQVKNYMEPRFGNDFSSVRVHTDSNAVLMSKSLNAQAFTHGRNIYFNREKFSPNTSSGKTLLAHELTHVVQQNRSRGFGGRANRGAVASQSPQVMRKVTLWPGIHKGQIARTKEPKVLKDFAQKFSAAADLVRKSPAAMKLVRAAAAKGVAFGGYPLTKHGIKSRAYTYGNKVYIPKTRTDKFLAMSDFVFELNNAMRKSQSDKIKKLAKQRRITAKQYAYRIVKLEIEAMLNTGMIWFKMRQKGYKARKWSKYDKDFYLKSYKAFKTGKKTKSQLVKDALKRTYKTGIFTGWTVEKYYMAQY